AGKEAGQSVALRQPPARLSTPASWRALREDGHAARRLTLTFTSSPHQEATRFESGVPGQAEVLPVDRRLGLEGELFVAPGILRHAKVRHRKDNALRDAPDSEIAF